MRSCGKCTECCTECCTVMAITELKKPMWTPCSRLCSTGCSIYADRPASCAGWSCGWLQGAGPSAWRPDRSGIVLDAQTFSPELQKLLGARHDMVFIARAKTKAAFETMTGRAIVGFLVGKLAMGHAFILNWPGVAKAHGPAYPSGVETDWSDTTEWTNPHGTAVQAPPG